MDAADPRTFRDRIIQPALITINEYCPAAERLLLCTALAESGLKAVRQKGGGPALGYFQMEDATHNDLFSNYLGATKRQPILDGLHKLSSRVGYADELVKNPVYAAAMARIFYLRVKAPLPNMYSLEDIWHYYKKYWNTEKGAATQKHFMDAAAPAMAI